jgi:putative membrane protein
MPGFLLRWILNAIALWLTSMVVSGIHVSGPLSLLLAAMVLGMLNAVLRPALLLLTLPINLLTLGLFTFLINGFMLKLTGTLVPGFQVVGFWAAVLGAILLSLLSFLLSLFVTDSGRVQYIHIEWY